MEAFQEFLSLNYLTVKSLHLIAVMSWMAGLLYLPRLFVYHAQAEIGSELSETFKTMERRLMNFIMEPASIAAWVFGLLMLYANPAMLSGQGWMHAKLLLVVLMTGSHHAMRAWMKKFAKDENVKSHKFFRIANEIPTILMILIIVLAVVEPF